MQPRIRRARTGRRREGRSAFLALVVALLLAGCAKPEPDATEAAILPGVISGTVTDVALLPLAGVTLVVDGSDANATTDATGAFSFSLLPGEYVVLASHPDHRDGALRASVHSGETSTLAFTLTAISRIVPYHEAQEAQGYIACSALLVQGTERRVTPCGQNDPNDRSTVAFPLATTQGLEALVLELAWEPRTSAASHLHAEVFGRDGEQLVALGRSEGTSPLTLRIPGRLISTDTLVVSVGPAGGMTDEEAGADAGVVAQQPFTAYATAFYHAPPPGDFSAIQASS